MTRMDAGARPGSQQQRFRLFGAGFPTMGSAATLLALACTLAGTLGCDHKAAGGPGAEGAAAMGPMPVTVVTTAATDVPVRSDWVGTLDGYVNAQIQPQVSGYLLRQLYKEGSPVSKGQVLFQIDPRPFQAALDQAQGQVGQAKGQLAQAQGQVGQAEAQQGLTAINVNRDTPLAQQRAIAQSQLDNDKQQAQQSGAAVASAKAQVESARAAIASAQAAVETARLNLGFTQVRSLISGVAGQATTQVGNLVSPQSVLTSVSQLDPIKVYFSVSDSEYLSLSKRAHASGGNLLQGVRTLPLALTLADGTKFPQTGHIEFVDRQMNQQTGAIRVAAVFANPGNVLRPGQFGRVSADAETLHGVLLVPQAAVTDLQGTKQVYTVGADNKVHVVNVTLGPQAGSNWVVTAGLQPGVRVITDQLQKLKDGVPVSAHEGPAAAPTIQTTQSAGR